MHSVLICILYFIVLALSISHSSANVASDALKAHNSYRQRHGLPSLRYSKQIAKVAQAWAQQLAREARLRHRPNNKYGENLYASFGRPATGRDACKSWYDEIRGYNFKAEPRTLSAGHFTQMVWKGSKQIGIGVARSGNRWFIVANYYPRGNIIGQFKRNVPPPKNRRG